MNTLNTTTVTNTTAINTVNTTNDQFDNDTHHQLVMNNIANYQDQDSLAGQMALAGVEAVLVDPILEANLAAEMQKAQENSNYVAVETKPKQKENDMLKNIVDYTASVSRLTVETLVLLAQSPEYRSNFKPLLRSKDPLGYMEAALVRLDSYIQEGKLGDIEVSPEFQKEIDKVEDELSASLKGFNKRNLTEAEAKKERDQLHVSTFISMGKVAQRFMDLYPAVSGEESWGGHWYQILKYSKTYAFNGQAQTVYTKVAEEMGILDLFLAANWSLHEVKNFVNRNKIITKYLQGVTSIPVYNGIRAIVTPSKIPRIKALAIGRSASKQPTYVLNEQTLSSEHLNAISRVLVVTKSGKLGRYNKKSFNNKGGMDLRNICVHMSYTEILSLMDLAGAEMGSLIADKKNFLVIEYHTYSYQDKATGEEKTVETYRVSPNAYENKTVFEVNSRYSFWGVSNPDTLNKGIIRAFDGAKGFGEAQENGAYVSFEKEANKMVARMIKLCREGDTFTLPSVAVVVGKTGPQLTAALSTGAIHVPTSVLAKHGQCRVVSRADQGGMKATFGSVAFMGEALDLAGITVASFGSLKSNRYGLNCLLGRDPMDNSDFETEELYLENVDGGCVAEVIMVKDVPVTITNNYTLNEYRMKNRNDLFLRFDDSNEAMVDRIAAKASEINEDKIFVDFIKEKRDTEYGGNLMECLKDLLAARIIRHKGATVSITSSEHDVVTYCMGREKAKELQDSLFKGSNNLEQREKFKFVKDLQTKTYDYNRVKFMEAEELFSTYKNICIKNNISYKTFVGSFVSRDFLVDLCLELFGANSNDYDYLGINVNGQPNGFIPLGQYFTGSFAEESNIFNSKVVTTGFLAKVLKYLPYPAAAVGTKAYGPQFARTFCNNINNELTVDLLGKQLGKMEAKGFYGVLQPAWWEDDIAAVICPGIAAVSKLRHCMLAKHPLLMAEALTGAKAKSKFPSKLIASISDYDMSIIKFAFNRTIFAHEDWLLALMNDCDGDLGRITFHKDVEFPLFEAKALQKGFFMQKWHLAYKKDEQNFTKIKDIKSNTFDIEKVMNAISDSAYAKSCVATFSANAQRLGQRFFVDATSPNYEFYTHAQLIINSWVQVYAMNAIKQQAGGKSDTLMLPEYFIVWNLHEEVRTTGKKEFLKYLKEVLKVNMAKHGYKSNEDFIERFTTLLENLQDKAEGTKMIGKDMQLSDLKDFSLDLDGLNPEILQDRLVQKFL